MAPAGRLKLDRGRSNNTFGSWRLDSSADVEPAQHRLPGRVAPALAGGEGFLQTKTVVQFNLLHEQPGGTYVFLQQGQEPPAVHRVEWKDDAAGIAVHRLSGKLGIWRGSMLHGKLAESSPETLARAAQTSDPVHGSICILP